MERVHMWQVCVWGGVHETARTAGSQGEEMAG